MAKKIFVNLPVKDLEASKTFFTGLGFGLDTRFMDETAACVVLGSNMYAMILTHDKFRQFTPKPIAEESVTEVLVCVMHDSREEVDALVDKALLLGGKEVRPADDMGFMYGRSFYDLDGHIWEIGWMDMSQMMAAEAD